MMGLLCNKMPLMGNFQKSPGNEGSGLRSRPHQKGGDHVAESGQGEPASAQKWNLAMPVQLTQGGVTAGKRAWPSVACVPGPGKAMGTVPERLGMRFQSYWSLQEFALVLSQLSFPPSQLSGHPATFLWISFSP